MLNEDVKKSIETNNMQLLKYTFCDCLDGDPTFKSYEEDYDYCVKHNILFEAHREINPMTLNKVSEEYWVQLKNDFLENPSTKRFNHMREVAKILYKDRIAAIEEQKRKAYEAAEKAKKAEAEKVQREAEAEKVQREAEAEKAQRETEAAKRSQNNTVANSSTVNTGGDGVRRDTERSQYQGNQNTNSAGTSPKKSSGMGLKLLILAIVIIVLIILVKNCAN